MQPLGLLCSQLSQEVWRPRAHRGIWVYLESAVEGPTLWLVRGERPKDGDIWQRESKGEGLCWTQSSSAKVMHALFIQSKAQGLLVSYLT